MANPTDNTSTPTGVPVGGSVVSDPREQQFVIWSDPWKARPSVTPWATYKAAIPASGQQIK
jgi:hypothetical protein